MREEQSQGKLENISNGSRCMKIYLKFEWYIWSKVKEIYSLNASVRK